MKLGIGEREKEKLGYGEWDCKGFEENKTGEDKISRWMEE